MKRRIQGGVIDPKHDTVWVTLRHDEERRETSIEIRDRAPWEGGRLLAATGVSGSKAKACYEKAEACYFGQQRQNNQQIKR